MYNFLADILAYPLYDLVKGGCITKCLRELEKTQWLSPEEIKARQWRKVQLLLRHAYDSVSFYRRRFDALGLRPEDIKEPRDLLQLPVLTKKDIKDNADDLISREFNKDDLFPMTTGGTTGEPTRFYFNREAASYVKAAGFRSWEWTGVRKSDKKVTLSFSGFDVAASNKIKGRLWHLVSRNKILPVASVTGEILHEYYRVIKKSKPKLLRGYASGILLLADYLRERKIDDLHVGAILTTADTIYPHERKRIESVFKGKSFDNYSSREFMIAGQCPVREGYHICAENVYLEFIRDNRHVEAGELGKIIVTDLRNFAFPFIRCEIGDMGVPSDKYCSCGRGLPLMESVQGRTYGYIVTPDGRIMDNLYFPHLVKEVAEGLKEYQVIQEKSESLLIKIVKAQKFNQRHVDFLLRNLRKDLGEQIDIKFEYCDKIPRPLSGKRQTVISKAPLKF